MNSSVSNKFPQSLPFSLQVQSPQARFFISCSKFRLQSHTIFILNHPSFQAACVRSMKTLPTPLLLLLSLFQVGAK